MDRKMKAVGFTGDARIFTTDAYEKHIRNYSKIVIKSNDKDYVLLLSEADRKLYYEMMLNIDFDLGKYSEEDFAYTDYLYEYCPKYYATYKVYLQTINLGQSVQKFLIDGNEASCLFDIQEAKKEDGAAIEFILTVTKMENYDVVVRLKKEIIDLDNQNGGEEDEE